MELKVHDQEILLQRLWKSRTLFSGPMTTLGGKPVEILFGGSHNTDAGPDFKDAVVKIDGRILHGDVEVHLNASGWYGHKHHNDPAYNGVILHIVSSAKPDAEPVRREDGVFVEQVLVALDAATIASLKDKAPDDEPDESGTQVIAGCPLSREKREKIEATIRAAGEIRFQDKVSQLREALRNDSWNQVLYQKMLEALGYAKNQKQFRRLAELVPFETLNAEMQWVKDEMAEMRCSALLFGAAGLLPSTSGERAALDVETRQYVTQLLDLWEGMSRRLEIKPMRPHEWQFFRLRPLNFPTRRLAGFVQMMMKTHKHGLLETCAGIVRRHLQALDKVSSELESAIKQRATGFWRGRYRFENRPDARAATREPLLIGKSRARDILVNILFPALYLYGEESNDSRLKNAAIELYRRFPRLTDNTITRAMSEQLHGRELSLRFAMQQQGLLHLNALYCRSLECARCLQISED